MLYGRRFKRFCACLLSFLILLSGVPYVALAVGSGFRLPEVTVPNVKIPAPEEIPSATIPPGSVPSGSFPHGTSPSGTPPSSRPSISTAPNSSLPSVTKPVASSYEQVAKKAVTLKDIISNAVKMSIDSKKVLTKSAYSMDDAGRIPGGGWKAVGKYAASLVLPWLGAVPVDGANAVADGIDLGIKGREAYQAVSNLIRLGTPLRSGVPKPLGAGFPIIGGLTGIANGSWEVRESFNPSSDTPEHELAGSFYSGAGDVLSGAGMLIGGIATAAGATALPTVAVAGSALLVIGLALGVVGYALIYFPGFAQSGPGRFLINLKNRIGKRFFG
ncbi:hypothetical protein [Effusibacillus lacus]|uniref:hypothetical protein n=1 Tax=Effusibacillus lacus TaxID=1348429 RepID=UPI0010517E05|nr:hypothetical protein [Effusibacillus lacus]TCS73625.1 hypothetical protein EDD64_11738 [Effusibacillus lacus]